MQQEDLPPGSSGLRRMETSHCPSKLDGTVRANPEQTCSANVCKNHHPNDNSSTKCSQFEQFVGFVRKLLVRHLSKRIPDFVQSTNSRLEQIDHGVGTSNRKSSVVSHIVRRNPQCFDLRVFL
jgi:hypothetical protein